MTDRMRLDQHTDDTLTELYDQLDQLRAVSRGYCPKCGRGDCAPTVGDWEQQHARAERAESERDQHAALLRRTEQYLAATHQHTARHDNLGENFTCSGCDLLACIRAALAGPAQLTTALARLADAVHRAHNAQPSDFALAPPPEEPAPMTDPAAPTCGAHPRHGNARCDLAAGHDGDHTAPIADGGRITYRPHSWERTPRDA